MSKPIINNLRRQIEDTKPKPGSMVAGFPKATVNICDLESLITRYELLLGSLDNCYMMSRRLLAKFKRRNNEGEENDELVPFISGLVHITRFCEEAGLKPEILRTQKKADPNCSLCKGSGRIVTGWRTTEAGNEPDLEECECWIDKEPA